MHALRQLVVGAILSFGLIVGCGGGGGGTGTVQPPATPLGTVSISVTPPSRLSGPVDRSIGLVEVYVVTVTHPSLTSPVVWELQADPNTHAASGSFKLQPLNEATFTVEAKSAAGAVYYRGSATASVVAGKVTKVEIALKAVEENVELVITIVEPDTPEWTGTIAVRLPSESDPYEKGEIWFLRPTGEPQLVVDDAYWYGSVRWSPDGRYFSYENSNGALALADRDGNTVRSLGTLDRQHSWTPDSKYVLTGKYYDGLWRLGVDGTAERILTSASKTYDHNPVVSRDGKWLYWLHHEFGSNGYIRRAPFDSGTLGAVEELVSISTAHDESVQLEPTPDGQVIVVYDSTIALLDPEGKTLTDKLSLTASYARLSSDGAYLACCTYSGVQLVSTSTWKSELQAQVPESYYWARTLTWAPDAERVAFSDGETVYVWQVGDDPAVKVFDVSDVRSRMGRTAYGEQDVASDWAF